MKTETWILIGGAVAVLWLMSRNSASAAPAPPPAAGSGGGYVSAPSAVNPNVVMRVPMPWQTKPPSNVSAPWVGTKG